MGDPTTSSRTIACVASTLARTSACNAVQLPSMKPTLQFRLSQHLTLTPQLQQSIRLLQLSTVELNQEIERLLMDNPILEREESEPDSAAGNAPRSESATPDA